MRLFKWIFRIFLSLIILIVLVVGIPIAMLYKSVTPPATNNNLILEDVIDNELEKLVDETNNDKKLALSLDEEVINNEIKKLLVEALKDNLSDDDKYVADLEGRIFIQGAWVELKEDIIDIHIGVHINAEILTFKTRLLISLKILESSPSKIVLKVNTIKAGNLPLKWVLKMAPKLLDKYFNTDIDGMIANAFQGFGSYDAEKQEVTVDIKSLLKESDEMIKAILKLIEEEELIIFGVNKDIDTFLFEIGLDLNKIKSTKTILELLETEKIRNEDDFNSYIKNKALTGLISSKISFSDKDFLKVLDYLMLESDPLAKYLLEEKLYLDYSIKLLIPYFEITDKAVLNIPILFGTETDNLNINISLDVQFQKNNDDLILSFTNTTIGDVELDDELLKSLLTGLNSENTNINGLDFVLPNFFKIFTEENIEVKDIVIEDNKINFILDSVDVKNFLNEVITTYVNNEITNIVNDLLDKINNNEDIKDDLEELSVKFSELSDSDKESLMEIADKYFK